MPVEPEISGVDLVLVGSFNPAIFTPDWFESYGLLPGAAESVENAVVAPELARFGYDWLHLQVSPTRFQASTAQAPLVRVPDLVARVFQEQLFHTPILAIGINREVHMRVGTAGEAELVWENLAPLEVWGGEEALATGGTRAGITSLAVARRAPEGRPRDDRINVTVEPSVRLSPYGIYIRVNDHYTVEGDPLDSAKRAADLLVKEFDSSVRHSDEIIDRTMSLATQPEES